MELVSLRCNRDFTSASSYGFGWYKYAIATQWYQFHTTDAWWFSLITVYCLNIAQKITLMTILFKRLLIDMKGLHVFTFRRQMPPMDNWTECSITSDPHYWGPNSIIGSRFTIIMGHLLKLIENKIIKFSQMLIVSSKNIWLFGNRDICSACKIGRRLRCLQH